MLKRNIVQVIPYYPPHLGGAEQRVKELSILEADQGLKVTVLTSNIGTPTGTYNQGKVEVHYLRGWEFLRAPIVPSLFWHLVRLDKRSIIHLHIAQAFFPEVVASVAKSRGIPYVAHVRAIVTPSSIWGKLLLPIYNRLLLGWVIRGAAKVIVLTPDYLEIVQKKFNLQNNRIVVIPNATNFTIANEPRKTFHTPLRFLAVGRISVQKNYPLMLKVLQSLKKDFKIDFRLTIAGTGALREKIEADLQKNDLVNNVLFAGEVTGKSLEKLYDESDILLHTSVFETFGTIFIEAMAKGVPIVATNVPGTRNVVQNGRNGVLANSSVAEMTHAVITLINNPTLYQSISKNNLMDVKQYDWTDILNKTQEVYREIENQS